MIQSAVTSNFSMLLRYLLQMVISLCVMFYVNAKLTAMLVSIFPVVVVVAVQCGERTGWVGEGGDIVRVGWCGVDVVRMGWVW